MGKGPPFTGLAAKDKSAFGVASTQQILVAETTEGWRVLNVVE